MELWCSNEASFSGDKVSIPLVDLFLNACQAQGNQCDILVSDKYAIIQLFKSNCFYHYYCGTKF